MAKHRRSGRLVSVQTISLMDLLIKHEAPKHIDYMSVDTEGSEYEILNAFDFDAYSFGLVSVEHNYSGTRTKIQRLLENAGYRRIPTPLSRFDDWYIPA